MKGRHEDGMRTLQSYMTARASHGLPWKRMDTAREVVMPATVLRRNLLFTAAIVGGLVACSDSATTPTIPPPLPPPPLVTVTVDPTSDWQTGVVGTPLTRTAAGHGAVRRGTQSGCGNHVAGVWRRQHRGRFEQSLTPQESRPPPGPSVPSQEAIRGSVEIPVSLDPVGFFTARALRDRRP
jgi:hypothetical protein